MDISSDIVGLQNRVCLSVNLRRHAPTLKTENTLTRRAIPKQPAII